MKAAVRDSELPEHAIDNFQRSIYTRANLVILSKPIIIEVVTLFHIFQEFYF